MKKQTGVISNHAIFTDAILNHEVREKEEYINGKQGEEEEKLDKEYIEQEQAKILNGIPTTDTISKNKIDSIKKELISNTKGLIYFADEEEYINKVIYSYFCYLFYKEGLKVPFSFDEFEENEEGGTQEENPTIEPHSIKNQKILHKITYFFRAVWDLHVSYSKKGFEPTETNLIEWSQEITKKYQKELEVIETFVNGLDENTPLQLDIVYLDSVEDSNKEETHLIFYHGYSLGSFEYKDGEFYDYDDNKIDLNTYWGEYLKTYRLFRKIKKKMVQSLSRLSRNMKEDPILGILLERPNTVMLYFNGSMFEYQIKEGALYRTTGEIIHDIPVVMSEVFEENQKKYNQNKKAYSKALSLFLSVLNQEQKDQYAKENAVLIKGKDFDYIIVSPEHIGHNNIIRIPHNKEVEIKSLCLGVPDYIPRMDVLSTIVMLIKSGNEEKVNEQANEYDLFPSHQYYIDNIMKNIAA